MFYFQQFKFISSLILLTSIIFSLGCTRKTEDLTTLSFSIPSKQMVSGKAGDASAQSSDLNYIALNISGPQLNAIFCSYDVRDKRTTGPCTFADMVSTPKVNIELPAGDGRLIQALVAYEDSSNQQMSFYYDDEDSVSMKVGSPSTVALTLVSLATDFPGHVQGRYFNSPTSGPTGKLQVKMKVALDKPSVTVQETEIYAGWFHAFLLQNTRFEYVVNSSEVLFGSSVNKADFVAMDTAGDNVLVNGSVNSGFDVVGFFGNSTAVTDKVALANGILCSSQSKTDYVNCLRQDLKFTGPFKGQSNGLISITPAGSGHSFDWAFLPDAGAAIDGVEVFYASSPMTSEQLDQYVLQQGVNCEAIRSNSSFTKLSTTTSTSTGEVSLSVNPNSAQPLVVCPKRGSVLMTHAATIPEIQDGGGCQDCKYLRFEIMGSTPVGDKYEVAKEACYEIRVGLYEGMGTPVNAPAGGVSVNGVSISSGTFYSDSGCASTTGGDFSVAPATPSSSSKYLKFSGDGLGKQFSVGTIAATGVFFEFQPQHNLVDVLSPVLSISLPDTMIQNTCYQGSLQLKLPNGQPYNSYAYVSVNLAAATGSEVGDASCSSTSASTTLNVSGNYPASFGVKLVNNVATSLTASAVGYANVTKAIAFGAGSQVADKIKVLPSNPILIGECNAFQIAAFNSENVQVPIKTTVDVELSDGANGSFYTGSNDCLNNYTPTSIVTVYANTMSQTVYYRPGALGAKTLSVKANGQSLPVEIPATTVTAPSYSTPWLSINNPPKVSYQSKLGSHNFPYSVEFQAPSGSAVECSINGMGTDCGGALTNSGGKYYLEVTAAQLNMTPTYLISVTANGVTREYPINKQTLLKDASIYTCDATFNNGATLDAISTALGTQYTACLNEGSFSKGGGSASSIQIGNSRFLIGKVDLATGALMSNVASEANYPVVEAIVAGSAQAVVANINFQLVGNNSKGISTSSVDYAYVESYNNIFRGDIGSAATGIHSTENISLRSTNDTFFVKANGAAATGIYWSAPTSNNNVMNAKFNLDSSGGFLATGIAFVTNDLGMKEYYVNRSSFSGGGVPIRAIGGVNYPVNVNLSFVNVSNQSSVTNSYAVYTNQKVKLNFNSSVVVQDSDSSAVKMENATDSWFAADNSYFKLLKDQYALAFATINPSDVFTINLNNTQFIKKSSGIVVSAIKDLNNNATSTADTSYGGNSFCGSSNSAIWSAAYSGPATTGSLNLAAIVPVVGVSSADLCKQ